MPADSIRVACPSAIDTTGMAEGEPYRLFIAVIDGDTIRVNIDSNSVRSIKLESPRFQTTDSLRVGMPVSRLLDLPDLGGGYGEGELYAFTSHPARCGLSFRLDPRTASAHRGNVTKKSLEPYAATGRVTAILILGC